MLQPTVPPASAPRRSRLPILVPLSTSVALVAAVTLLSTLWSALPTAGSVGAAGDCTVSASDLVIDTDEQTLLTLINDYRRQNGLGTWAFSTGLNHSAAWMSRDMATKAYFSHTDSLGRDVGARMIDCGYTNVFTWRGENIAAGYQTPAQVLQAWKNSPGHNGLMLDPKYVAAGIGRVDNPAVAFEWYWTLDAASAMDAPASLNPSVPSPTAIPVPATPTAPPATATSRPSNPSPTPTSPLATATRVPPSPTSPPATATRVPPTPTSPPPTATRVPPTPTSPPPTAASQPPAASPPPAGLVASGNERLLSPGFESGLGSAWYRPDWFAGVADVESTVTHSGSAAFGFHGKMAGPYLQQSVPARSEIVSVSGWVNVPTRNSSMNGSIQLVAINGNNGVVRTYTVYSFGSTTRGWVPVSYTSPQLPGGTRAVLLKVAFPQLDGTVYVDDLSIHTP